MQTLPLQILPPITEQGTGGNSYGASPVIGAIIYRQMTPPVPAEGRYGLTLSLPLTLRVA